MSFRISKIFENMTIKLAIEEGQPECLELGTSLLINNNKSKTRCRPSKGR